MSDTPQQSDHEQVLRQHLQVLRAYTGWLLIVAIAIFVLLFLVVATGDVTFKVEPPDDF